MALPRSSSERQRPAVAHRRDVVARGGRATRRRTSISSRPPSCRRPRISDANVASPVEHRRHFRARRDTPPAAERQSGRVGAGLPADVREERDGCRRRRRACSSSRRRADRMAARSPSAVNHDRRADAAPPTAQRGHDPRASSGANHDNTGAVAGASAAAARGATIAMAADSTTMAAAETAASAAMTSARARAARGYGALHNVGVDTNSVAGSPTRTRPRQQTPFETVHVGRVGAGGGCASPLEVPMVGLASRSVKGCSMKRTVAGILLIAWAIMLAPADRLRSDHGHRHRRVPDDQPGGPDRRLRTRSGSGGEGARHHHARADRQPRLGSDRHAHRAGFCIVSIRSWAPSSALPRASAGSSSSAR